MIEYLKFWLSQAVVGVSISAFFLLLLFLAALWRLRGQKFYKESKAEKAARKARGNSGIWWG